MPPIESRRTDPRAALAFLAFAALLVLFAANHELTLDEAQAWNVARLAAAPLDVVAIGAHEGHTPLWHLVLWPFARSGDPTWMRLVGVLAALAFAAAWLRHRPFGFLPALLVLFGYFTAFRYPTLVRNYALLLPLIALLALSIRRDDARLVRRCALCGLVAMNGAFGVILSLPLVAVALAQTRERWRPDPWLPLRGLAVYAPLAIAAVAFVVLPVRDSPFAESVLSGGNGGRHPVFGPIADAAFPHATDLPLGIGPWLGEPLGRALLGAGALGVVVAIGVLLLPWRAGTIAWGTGVALHWGASNFAGLVEERYAGHLVLLALTLLWVRPAFVPGGTVRDGRLGTMHTTATWVTVPALLWHVGMTAGVGGIDVLKTTSNGEAAAALIAAAYPSSDATPTPITSQSYDAAAVVALLDRAAFDTDCRCLTRYRSDSTRRAPPPVARIEADWCALVAAGHDVVAMFPDGRHRPDARHEILGTLGRSERFREPVTLYRLREPRAQCTAAGATAGTTHGARRSGDEALRIGPGVNARPSPATRR